MGSTGCEIEFQAVAGNLWLVIAKRTVDNEYFCGFSEEEICPSNPAHEQ
jgi:hypothetical protein